MKVIIYFNLFYQTFVSYILNVHLLYNVLTYVIKKSSFKFDNILLLILSSDKYFDGIVSQIIISYRPIKVISKIQNPPSYRNFAGQVYFTLAFYLKSKFSPLRKLFYFGFNFAKGPKNFFL